MYKHILETLTRITIKAEKGINKLFSSRNNPLYYHGALPTFMFFTLIFTGIMLWFYYVPTLDSAFLSVKYIAEHIPFGNIIRGVHRYSADAMMIYVLLHMLKVYFTDRHRTYRHIVWLSGIILLVFTLMIGISGYQLVWDEKAYALTQMLVDVAYSLHLPFIAHLIQGGPNISDNTITALMFWHVGLPGLVFVFLWMHFLRIKKPVASAPASLNFLMLGIVLVIAGAFPVAQSLPAVIGKSPAGKLELDLLFLYWIPMVNVFGVWATVILHVLAVAVLLGFPYLIKELRRNVAQVNDVKCVGCKLCAIDCPYNAVTMIVKPGQDNPNKLLAIVNRNRCAECGICVGACAFDALDLPGMDYKAEINKKLDEILKVPVVG